MRRTCAERAVGVLSEIRVTGRIEQVELEGLVGERQGRRRNGDSTLLFDLEEIRRGRFGGAAGLDGPGLLNSASVEQQLLGERGLTGVTVGFSGGRKSEREDEAGCSRIKDKNVTSENLRRETYGWAMMQKHRRRSTSFAIRSKSMTFCFSASNSSFECMGREGKRDVLC